MASFPVNGFFWVVLAASVSGILGNGLFACGVDFGPIRLDFCQASHDGEIGALLQEISVLEAQKVSPQQCVRPAGLPAVGGQASKASEGANDAPASPRDPADQAGSDDRLPSREGIEPGPGSNPNATEGTRVDDVASAEAQAANPPSTSTPEEAANQPSDAACRKEDGAPKSGNGALLVLALDHSRSMNLPYDMNDRTAGELEALLNAPDASTRQTAKKLYDAYLKKPGRKRLDVLKDAVDSATRSWPDDIEIGAISFAGCGSADDLGTFRADARDDLLKAVSALRTRPATPLALALSRSMQKAKQEKADRSARIIVISDGRDTCDQDPCAVVASLAENDIPIDVISIGGQEKLRCVSGTTGGIFISRSKDYPLEAALADAIKRGGQDACRP